MVLSRLLGFQQIKVRQRVNGFNSILCVSSVQAAKLYYEEFKNQMAADPSKALKIATIYSYGANDPEAEEDGLLGEENSEDTSALDASSRDFLDRAIRDYNAIFHTNYSTDGDKFQNYYKDVSLRMKNKELDLLIVVNMFLTGFDATTLNTLWVDKNLRAHGLIQAFSRTNRILNRIKTFGNIVCFRNLQKRVDDAISLFGDKNASGIVLMQKFDDYYYGFIGADDKNHPGYVDMINELKEKYHLSTGEIEKLKASKTNWLREFINAAMYMGQGMNEMWYYQRMTGQEAYLVTSSDMFKMDKEILTQVDAEDSCVIAGRNGFSVFADHPNHLSIFIHAPL